MYLNYDLAFGFSEGWVDVTILCGGEFLGVPTLSLISDQTTLLLEKLVICYRLINNFAIILVFRMN